MPAELPPHLLDAVAVFVSQHGEAALLQALALGHLVPETLGKLSQRALQHSGDYHEDGLPHTVVIQSNPGAKDVQRRVEISLTTGLPDVVLRRP